MPSQTALPALFSGFWLASLRRLVLSPAFLCQPVKIADARRRLIIQNIRAKMPCNFPETIHPAGKRIPAAWKNQGIQPNIGQYDNRFTVFQRVIGHNIPFLDRLFHCWKNIAGNHGLVVLKHSS